MAQVSLPPGFRFHPTDVELVMYYLKRKVMEKRIPLDVITEIDIYKFGPWDLPDKSCLRSKDLEWYFFCPRERKYSNGARMKRATEYGYWKTTGKDRTVVYNERTVGMIKTLVFHKGKAPRGDRTDWVIYEYRLEDKDLADAGVAQDGYVICKIFQKSGPGPKNGAQYGAPFNEEEWMDDGEATCATDESFSLASLPASTPVIQNNQNSSIVTGTLVSGATCNGPSSESCPTTAQTVDRMLPEVPANGDVSMLDPDDFSFMLDMFTGESSLVPDERNENENLPMGLQAVHMVANDIYNDLGDLGDLGKWAELNEDGYNITTGKNTEMPVNQQFVSDDTSYLELNDLILPLEYPSNSQGFEHALTDSVPSYSGSCSKSEQHYYPGSYVQHVSAPVGSSVQSEGFCGFQNNLDVFQKDNIIEENANQGYRSYEATLNNSGLPAWQ